MVAKGLESQICTIAEGFLATNEKFDRRFDALENEGRSERSGDAGDDQFSHADLDTRIRTLEEGHRTVEEPVADLQTRLGDGNPRRTDLRLELLIQPPRKLPRGRLDG